jgi:hypothetical protein
MDYNKLLETKSYFLNKNTYSNPGGWKLQINEQGIADYSAISNFIRDFPDGYYPSYEFERTSLNFERAYGFMYENWWIPISTGILYLAVIFTLQEFMKERKALELKWQLFTWNLAIGLFSLVGFLRTAPDLLYFLLSRPNNGLHDSICLGADFSPRLAFWGILFAYSKIAELG